MKDFVKELLCKSYPDNYESIFDKSQLIQYLDSKMGAIYGNSKTRRSFANIYAIYVLLSFYVNDFYNKPEEYKDFSGYEYTKLFAFYRGLYGGEKLQNHALNSRVNGEFINKFPNCSGKEPIFVNGGKYVINIDYLYVDGIDISKIAIEIIEQYIVLIQEKDNQLLSDIVEFKAMTSLEQKKQKIKAMLNDKADARIFEIVSYAILRNHYKNISIFIGYEIEHIKKEYLTLYKTGRTNANDGGIDFVMRPLGRFFQVTEVNNYDKYTLDMDKVMHFPITFVIKTNNSKEKILADLNAYIEDKSGGMKIIKERYSNSIEEIITINELKSWLDNLDEESVEALLTDIDLYYRLELNIT